MGELGGTQTECCQQRCGPRPAGQLARSARLLAEQSQIEEGKGLTWTQSRVFTLYSSMSGGSMGFVFWAPGMVSAIDITVVLLCSAVRLKGVPEVKVMVLGSQGSSRKALSLNLRRHSLALRREGS